MEKPLRMWSPIERLKPKRQGDYNAVYKALHQQGVNLMRYNPDFIILPFEALIDSRLTLRQIRVLMAILSWRRKNTNVSAISREMISERTGYPMTRVSAITKELVDLGWLAKHGGGGRSKWVRYEISDLQKMPGIKGKAQTVAETVTVTESELNGYQNGNETVTKSGTRIDTDKEQIDNRETMCASEPLSEAFDIFWSAGMRKINKKKAQSLFNSIAKARKDDPLDFANMLADDIVKRVSSNQLGFGQMHPTTYLNGERWEDEISDDPVNHGLTDQDTTVPVDKIIDLYHRVCPNLPPVSVTTDPTLRSMIAERWNESPDQQSGDGFWVPFFIKANSRAQVFYRGQNIVPRLEALVSRAVFREIAEARS